jgi:glutaredoxin 2
LKKSQPDVNGKGQSFKTPKFYFDNLADRVIEKTQPVAPPQYQATKSIFSQIEEWVSVLMQPRWAMAMASVVILAVGSWFYLKKETIQTNETLTEITNDDIQEYIEANIEDFDENLLAENASNTPDTEGGILKDMTDEEIEQYLKEHPEEKNSQN